MAAPESFSHSRSLFITDLGPMRFYVRPGPLKRQLSPLITHGGGIMCRVQEPGSFLLAEPGQVQGVHYMSSTYITDCVQSNRKLSPRKYRLLNRATAGPGQSSISAEPPDKNHRMERKTLALEEAAVASREGAASAPCDQSPNAGGPRERNGVSPIYNASATLAPASCDRSPSPGASASGDPRPTIEAAVMKDGAAADETAESRGGESGVTPSTSGTGTDHTAEDQTKRGEAAQHQAVPGQSGPVRRFPFTRQEDLAILLYVQENETPRKSVTGTLLWKELEQKQLLKRTWQAMKCRYTRYILRHKYLYRLPSGGSVQAARKTTPAENPRDVTNQHIANPSTVGTTTDRTSQHHDMPAAETSLKSVCPHKEPPPAADLSGADTTEEALTNLATDANGNDGSCPGESTVIRRLRNTNRRIVTEVTPEPVLENGSSSEREEGNRVSVATTKQPPNPQESQDTDNSEDLQIFQIANMEFEVDDDSVCKVKVPGISLKDFVMGEDSVSVDTQMQVDDVTSSPDLSDSEGLQDALTDLMSEFKLDICQVTQALLKNNGEVGSTRHFLRTGLRPDCFPIWKHEDDVDLQRSDPTAQAQLANKYGADNVAKRAAFLAS